MHNLKAGQSDMVDGLYPFEPLEFDQLNSAEMEERSEAFLKLMRKRRTVRDFSSKPVPRIIIENAISVAATAPSGANMQHWHLSLIHI